MNVACDSLYETNVAHTPAHHISFRTSCMVYLNLEPCETNFWLSPSRIRSFSRFDGIHLANGLWMTSEEAVRGYQH